MICGGLVSNYSATASCWRLNQNGSWIQEEDMNRKRYGFSLTLFQNQALYAIGGSDLYSDQMGRINLATVEMFPVSSTQPRKWVQLEDSPFEITYHCAVALEHSLFLIGGTMLNPTHVDYNKTIHASQNVSFMFHVYLNRFHY